MAIRPETRAWWCTAFVLGLLVLSCGHRRSETPALSDDALSPASADEVLEAVVHIEAWGAAVAPGTLPADVVRWQGSGFIIDESGIVVTAAHLVNTATGVEVHLANETFPTVATVIAVSECADIALLALSGEQYPYLEWFDGDVTPGLEVFVAGYPNGDPTYERHVGEVKAVTSFGHFTWASVESSVQHTAATGPGTSGAPIITEGGDVIGVSIAHESDDVTVNFGVGVQSAEAVVERLLDDSIIGTIGVNARVWVPRNPDIAGIWVEAVEPDSPADLVGLEAGDIVTRIGGMSLRHDRTFKTYCEAMRSADVGESLAIQVLRPSSRQVLVGELHGEQLVPTVRLTTGFEELYDPPPQLVPDERRPD